MLQEDDPVLKLALPLIDSEWYERIHEVVERVKMPYSPSNLHHKAALLFYNINKAHSYIDGNKRSSIVILYLFYLINDRYIPASLNLKKLAKSVAKSKGRARQEDWIDKLEKCFKENVRLLNPRVINPSNK